MPSLAYLLEPLKDSTRIILNDKFMGDVGAK